MTLYQNLVAEIELDQWPSDPETCTEWQRSKTPAGYGMVRVAGPLLLVHRLAYCLHNGKTLADIDGKVIRHSCDNPSCFRVDHLLEGSHKDNAHDRDTRGRNHFANVTECPAGHEYAGSNLYIDARYGHRSCRACSSLSVADRRANRTPVQESAEKAYQSAWRANRTPAQKAATARYHADRNANMTTAQKEDKARAAAERWAAQTPAQKASRNATKRARYAERKTAAVAGVRS